MGKTPGRASPGAYVAEVALTDEQDVKLLTGYIRTRAFIVVTAAFVIGVALIVIGTLHGVPATTRNILQAVGSSVIASLILNVLISLLVDPKRQMAQTQQAMLYGVQLANRQFAERFEVALPTEVYESSKLPKPAFRDAFVELMSSSTRYDFRGDSASFTTYRLLGVVIILRSAASIKFGFAFSTHAQRAQHNLCRAVYASRRRILRHDAICGQRKEYP